MHWMKSMAEAPPETPADTGRGGRATLPKEQRKFQRYDRDAGAAEPAGGRASVGQGQAEGRGEEDPAAETAADAQVSGREKPSAPSRPLPTPLPGAIGRRVRGGGARRPLFWLALELGVAALLAVSFALGRASVARPAAPAVRAAPAAPGKVGEGATVNAVGTEAAELIDQAMAAEQGRDFARATKLLLDVQDKFPHVRGLDFQLANLALEQNDSAKALPLLNQSIAEGEMPAACYKLRGAILNRKGGINRGMGDLETATTVDPFGAENFYFWGEALRRAGKSQAALTRLRQAEDRLREPALEALYQSKIRLALIELGRQGDFAAEMSQRLAQNPPSPEWLFTAAAVAVQGHQYGAAADDLEKASRLMQPAIFHQQIGDFFFAACRFEPSLARFFTLGVASPPAASASPAGPGASPAPTQPASPAPTQMPEPAASAPPAGPAAVVGPSPSTGG